MKNFLKFLFVGILFFAFGIIFSRIAILSSVRYALSEMFLPEYIRTQLKPRDPSENYYVFIMRSALGKNIYTEDKKIINQIEALRSKSEEAFKALVKVCENAQKQVSQEFIEPLHKHGFVDITGQINSQFPAFKALQEIVIKIKTENPPTSSQVISIAAALNDFFKILKKSLETTEKGSYQESLLNFQFSFPSYRDLLQLFPECFLDKDYYFISTNKKPFIIDCGGNLGMSILFFKTFYPASEILVFEPSPNCLPFLNKNIKDNNLRNVTVIDKAISNQKGKCFFNEHHATTLGGRLSPKKNTKSLSVDSVLLSDYINKTVDFLKMDVEGAETLIFEDLDKSGKIKLVKEMVIECHSKVILNSVLQRLDDNNFLSNSKQEEIWGGAYIVHAFNKTI